MPVRPIHTRLAAFTLIELLIVVAIVALLVGLALPALAGARNAARGVACAARINQPATVLRVYAADNKDNFPRTQDASYGTVVPSYDPSLILERTWVDLITRTGYLPGDLDALGLPETLRCPSAAHYDNDRTWAGHMPHFGVNTMLSPPKRLEATLGQRSFFGRPFTYTGDPSSKIMMSESRHLTNPRGWFSMGNANWVAGRHAPGRGANTVYLDGHVAFRQHTDNPSPTDHTQAFASINFWRQPSPTVVTNPVP
jgi:prepilin-type N-terminal cleavage/methylation domain-containing protein/prepilin-type processing-associated H-X9-DG protein